MARTLTLTKKSQGIVAVAVDIDGIEPGTVDVAESDLPRWLGWATYKYTGVQVIDHRNAPQFESTRRYIAVAYEGDNWHIISGREASYKTGRRAICGAPVQAKANIVRASLDESNCYRCRKRAGVSIDGWSTINNMGGRRYR